MLALIVVKCSLMIGMAMTIRLKWQLRVIIHEELSSQIASWSALTMPSSVDLPLAIPPPLWRVPCNNKYSVSKICSSFYYNTLKINMNQLELLNLHHALSLSRV